MVLKGINWVHNDKIRSNGLERSQLGSTMQKSDHMVLKGVNCVYTMVKLGQMVLKGVNWVPNIKIRSYGLERIQLGSQCKKHLS